MRIEQRMIARKAIRLGWTNPPPVPAGPPAPPTEQAPLQTVQLDQVEVPVEKGTAADGG